jgi:hypothetical protein
MPMLFPHDPRRAEPLMGVFRGLLKNSYPHHNPPYFSARLGASHLASGRAGLNWWGPGDRAFKDAGGGGRPLPLPWCAPLYLPFE